MAIITEKNVSDEFIRRKLKRMGKSQSYIASYLKGWNAVKHNK